MTMREQRQERESAQNSLRHRLAGSLDQLRQLVPICETAWPSEDQTLARIVERLERFAKRIEWMAGRGRRPGSTRAEVLDDRLEAERERRERARVHAEQLAGRRAREEERRRERAERARRRKREANRGSPQGTIRGTMEVGEDRTDE